MTAIWAHPVGANAVRISDEGGDRRARPVWAEGLSHSQDGLGDNGDCDQFEAVHEPIADRAFERAFAISE